MAVVSSTVSPTSRAARSLRRGSAEGTGLAAYQRRPPHVASSARAANSANWAATGGAATNVTRPVIAAAAAIQIRNTPGTRISAAPSTTATIIQYQ
jgi:hypothetical protein